VVHTLAVIKFLVVRIYELDTWPSVHPLRTFLSLVLRILLVWNAKIVVTSSCRPDVYSTPSSLTTQKISLVVLLK